jgi:uncharacterized phiE125 gp8 family phage protein
MITITTSTTEDLLASLTNLKTDLELDDTKHDVLLTRYLKAASHRIEQEIGYPLHQQTYQERVRGWGTQDLLVSRRPVVSLDSIWRGTDSGDPVSTDQYILDDEKAGLMYGTQPFSWDVGASPNLDVAPIQGQERLAYTVNYTAGYLFPGNTSTGATLPESIQQAVIETAKMLYEERQAGDGTVKRKQLGDLELEYAVSANKDKTKLPDIALMLIEPYRSLS